MNKLRQKNAKKLHKKTKLPQSVAGRLIKNKPMTATAFFKIGAEGLKNLKDAKAKLLAGLIASSKERNQQVESSSDIKEPI